MYNKSNPIPQKLLDKVARIKSKYPGIGRTKLAKILLDTGEFFYYDKSGEKVMYRLGGLEGLINKQANPDYRNRQPAVKSQKENPPKAQVEGPSQIPAPLSDRIKKLCYNKQHSHDLESLSDAFNVGIGKIKDAIKELIEGGHNVTIEGGKVIFDNIIPRKEPSVLNIKKMSNGFYRFAVLGDNHLCSKYERMDVLNALYDHFKAEGITTVYNTGNWIDGEARFNKHDLHTHGLDNQLQYMLEHYPRREGITTKYITGDDHEGWYTQREGIDVGKHLKNKAKEAGRDDLIYLGHMEHDEIIKAPNGQTKIRILHPGGGSSYAISYAPQKIIESYTGGDKPHILVLGHYHKAGYEYIRGVHTIQTACTQDQTPFMRKKKLSAHLGGWIFEFATDKNGAITRFKTEFFPFYDTDYYKSNWEYKW